MPISTDHIPISPVESMELLPLSIYTAVAVLLIAFLLGAAWWLGAGTRSYNKEIAYESVPFYLVAIFFIVFDVEAVFIFAWGVAWDLLGIAGIIHITFFVVVLLLGLVWLWIKGGLEWGPSRERNAPFPQSRR
jgi:NADH-quinone oxidoreductase subunit A